MEVFTIVGNKDSIYLPKTIEISYDQRHKQQDKRIRIRDVSLPSPPGCQLEQTEKLSANGSLSRIVIHIQLWRAFDQWEAGTGNRGSCNIVPEHECMILPAFKCLSYHIKYNFRIENLKKCIRCWIYKSIYLWYSTRSACRKLPKIQRNIYCV
jgi:hypothetical protein